MTTYISSVNLSLDHCHKQCLDGVQAEVSILLSSKIWHT